MGCSEGKHLPLIYNSQLLEEVSSENLQLLQEEDFLALLLNRLLLKADYLAVWEHSQHQLHNLEGYLVEEELLNHQCSANLPVSKQANSVELVVLVVKCK